MDEFIYTAVLSIYQQTRTGAKEAYPSTPNYVNINACLTPMKTEIQMAYANTLSFQLFNVVIYDTTVTIKNDDKLVTQDGVEYIVDGMPALIETALLSFIKVIAKKKV